MFQLIILEKSILPQGRDFRGILEGTAAGTLLESYIEYADCAAVRRREYEASQRPEARAARREVVRAATAAAHAQRQEKYRSAYQKALDLIEDVSSAELLERITGHGHDVSMRNLGGILYRRLLDHYRAMPMQKSDREILSQLAKDHGGRWKKLADELQAKS